VLFVLADKALTSSIIVILVWVIAFPVLVQGLIVYAVIQARGEKRANQELRRRRES
jgi:heme/copper-type cytochrome/quinol oxidase subunit 2